MIEIKECSELFADKRCYFGLFEGNKLLDYLEYELEGTRGVIHRIHTQTNQPNYWDGLIRGFLNYLLLGNLDTAVLKENTQDWSGYFNEEGYCDIKQFFEKGCSSHGKI